MKICGLPGLSLTEWKSKAQILAERRNMKIMIQNVNSSQLHKRYFLLILVFFFYTFCFAQPTQRELVLAGEDSLAQQYSAEKTSPELHFFTPHTGGVISAIYSPDGKYIASVSETLVKIWDVSKRKEIRTFSCVARILGRKVIDWSPDSRCVYISSKYGTISKMNIETGKEVYSIDIGIKEPNCIDVSKNDEYLLISGYEGVQLWSLKENVEVFKNSASTISSACFSNNGKYFAFGNDKALEIYNTETRKKLYNFEDFPSTVEYISWSNDSTYIVASNGFDSLEIFNPVINLYYIEDGKKGRFIPPESIETGDSTYVDSLCCSPDGKYIAIAISSNGNTATIKFWNVKTEEISEALLETSVLDSFSWSPDSSSLVVTDYDEVTIFNIENKQVQILGDYVEEIYRYDLGWKQTIGIFSMTDNFEDTTYYKPLQYGNESVSWSFDSKYRITSDSDASFTRILNVSTGEEKTFNHSSNVLWSKDSKYVALSYWDNGSAFIVFEVGTWKEIYDEKPNEDDNISGRILGFTSDNKSIIISKEKWWSMTSFYSQIIIHDIETNTEKVLYCGYCHDICMSNDNTKIAIYTCDDNIEWRIFSNISEVHEFNTDRFDYYQEIEWSPSGKYILGSKIYDIVIWNTQNTSNSNQLKIPAGLVDFVVWSSDEKQIITISGGILRFWNTDTGELLLTCINGKNDEYIAYTPEGLFSGTDWACKNYVYIVDGLEITDLNQMYDKLYRPDLIAAKIRGEDISDEFNFQSILKQGKAPVVSLLEGNSITDDGYYIFNFSVEDTGGGIGYVRYFLNEAPKIVASYQTIENNKAIYQLKVPLQTGNNTIELFASNKAQSIESKHKTINVKWDGKIEKPNLFVLTLGINKYKIRQNWLEFAVPDAQAVSDAFCNLNSTLFKDIFVFSLFDNEVTKDGITEKFKELSKLIKKDDVFILYLAGHGRTYNADYYYIPVDYYGSREEQILEMGISKYNFIEYLSQLDASKILILIDTCGSGGFVGTTTNKELKKTRSISKSDDTDAIRRLKAAVGCSIISACKDNQYALEGYEGHGVFTYVLLEALNGNADLNKDGYISVNELNTYLYDGVYNLTGKIYDYNQETQYEPGGDFPIVKVEE